MKKFIIIFAFSVFMCEIFGLPLPWGGGIIGNTVVMSSVAYGINK